MRTAILLGFTIVSIAISESKPSEGYGLIGVFLGVLLLMDVAELLKKIKK